MKARERAEAIRALHLPGEGFGGYCGAAAITINRDIFGGKGRYVAGVNAYMLDAFDLFFGHVAVLHDGRYWDASGETNEEALLDWGYLDYDDPPWDDAAIAKRFGKEAQRGGEFGRAFPPGWTPARAEKAVLVEFENETEVLRYLRCA